MDFPIEMYKIREEEITIKVPCESCYEKGMVVHDCHKCGGKGIHNKTIKVWKVARKTVTIEKISRGGSNQFYHGKQTSYDGGLQYWTGSSEFYNEHDLYLHFTKEDAQKECDKRNRDISDILNNIKLKQLKNMSCGASIYRANDVPNPIEKILSELGYVRVSDLLEDVAKQISMKTAMSMTQVADKVAADFCNNINAKEVITRYLIMAD